MQNWEIHFKSKAEALEKLFESLVLNPACAGADGYITISMGKNLYRIKPVKKSKQSEV